MRLPTTGSRWVLCALALTLATNTAFADKKKKSKVKARESVAACTTFDQLDRDDDSVDLVIGSTCEVAVSCSVSWSLICAPGSKKAHKTQHGQAFSLTATQSQSTNASAGTCGNDGWTIDDVVWSCNPE